jgi:septal ring factor EnvC (AmiA/AmiB activator)
LAAACFYNAAPGRLFLLLSAPYAKHAAQNSGTQKSVESKKAQINQLQKDIAFLDSQIAQTKKKRKNTLEELALIRRKSWIKENS